MVLAPTGSLPLNGAQNHGCVYLQAGTKTAEGALRTAYFVWAVRDSFICVFICSDMLGKGSFLGVYLQWRWSLIRSMVVRQCSCPSEWRYCSTLLSQLSFCFPSNLLNYMKNCLRINFCMCQQLNWCDGISKWCGKKLTCINGWYSYWQHCAWLFVNIFLL